MFSGLAQVDGAAHVIHAEEEVSGTRLIIDNLTVLLPNEHDPSRLQAHSPGKLVRCAPAPRMCCQGWVNWSSGRLPGLSPGSMTRGGSLAYVILLTASCVRVSKRR